MESPHARGTALVTGATGLIGGEITRELVDRGWSVIAVVRAPNDRDADHRLSRRLSQSSRARLPGWPGLMETSRVTALAGDVTAEDLGVSAVSTRGIDLIVHCAGETSFNHDERCWNTNVRAAQRLIDLVRKMAPRPRVFFISTASVCTIPPHLEISEEADPGGAENGYLRSKRRAEQLLIESGLDPVIFRPSIVLSRGIRSRRMARSILWVMPVMRELGEVPVNPQARIDLVPVDYVAETIGRLIDQESLRYRCYHISAGLRASNTCAEIRAALCREEPSYHRMRFMGSGAFSDNPPGDQALWTALNYYLPFINADVTYSTQRLSQELGPDLPQCPEATQYINEIIGRMSLRSAIRESGNP